MDIYSYLREAIESLLTQTYGDIEIVVVSDGNERLYNQIIKDYGDCEKLIVGLNQNDGGDNNVDSRNQSRMHGVKIASGDVVAFMDDDAVADPDWIENIANTYKKHDAIAVGGKLVPLWEGDKPDFFPEEFYWLIGATHKGFAPDDEITEVRNTFASNISFRQEVFIELGGFDTSEWSKSSLQGEEAELCLRMKEKHGEGVMYNPDAVVGHVVPKDRTKLRWLVKRSFWQGYWKRAMGVMIPETGDEEFTFLRNLLFRFMPDRLWKAVTRPSLTEAKKFVMLILFTTCVGFGYLYGFTRWR